MDMELDAQEAGPGVNTALMAGIAQLAAAAEQLDRATAALSLRFGAVTVDAVGGEVPKVVAAVDPEPSSRLAELEAKLQSAEQKIAELCAQAQSGAQAAPGRKTLPVAASQLLAKHGLDSLEQVNGGALDAALTGLSLEQRIAVKSQLLRAGLLG
jgi:uncharacterized protein (DUF3084 family)